MILERLPKITRIEGGTKELESAEFLLENYRVAAFLFENPEENSLTVMVKANTKDGEAEPVPFLLKAADETEYEEVGAEGKTLKDAGAFVAAVSADSLSHKEFDRVSICLAGDADLPTVYALQSQPRYTDNE